MIDFSYLAPVGGVVLAALAWTFRRLRRAAARDADPFLSYLWGNVSYRVRGFFSDQAAGHLGARRYASVSLRDAPSTLDVPCLRPTQMQIDRAYIRLALASDVQEEKDVFDQHLLDRDKVSSMLVLGDAGSGKSTLCLKLFRDAAGKLLSSPRTAPLPILVQLRSLPWTSVHSYEDGPGSWLSAQISDRIDEMQALQGGAFVYDTYLHGRGVVVLLDGLDEVPAVYLAQACEAIDQYRRLVVSCDTPYGRVVTTGRRQLRYMASRDFLQSFAEVLTIKPLAPADIYSFLENWHYRADRSPAVESARIFLEISENVSLRAMCGNPLVLAMYVARDQLYLATPNHRSARVPDQRTGFYSEIVNELLRFRREDRDGAEAVDSRERRKREDVLSSLALEHLLDPGQPPNSLSYRDAVDRVLEVHSFASTRDAERELEQTAVDSGLFTQERKGESIRFMHLTLCEFLAARELHERGEAEATRIVDRYISGTGAEVARLTEVVVFLCGMFGREARRSLLQRLVESPAIACSAVPLRILLEVKDDESDLIARIVSAHRERYAADQGPVPLDVRSLRLLCELLNAVQVDAPHREGPNELPGPADLVRTLCEASPSGRRLFPVMFPNLLAVVPEDAMALRDRLGPVEALEPGPLLAALEEPRVIEFAVRRVRAQDPDWQTWALALAEAALQHRLVAKMLAGMPAGRSLEPATDGEWSQRGVIAGTFYGSVLDCSLRMIGEGTVREGTLRRLGVLGRYPPELLDAGDELRDILNLEDLEIFSLYRGPDAVVLSRNGMCDVWARRNATVAIHDRVTTTAAQRLDVYLADAHEFALLADRGLDRLLARLLLGNDELELRSCTVDYRQTRGWMRWRRKGLYSLRWVDDGGPVEDGDG